MSNTKISTILNHINSQIINNNQKKILLVVPGSAGDILLCTSLFASLKRLYRNFDIYFACEKQYKDILKNNPYLTRIIEFHPIMQQSHMMEGYGKWNGIFDICFVVTANTQLINNYIHNGIDNIGLNLRETSCI